MLLLLALPAARSASAQAGLRGRVVMEPTEAPVPGAEVVIAAVDQSTVTNAKGEFEIPSFRPGEHEILIRRIGFAPRKRKLKFRAGETLQIEVLLTPTVTVIESLVVVGKPPLPTSGRFVAFERRRAGHDGHFMTWADLRLRDNMRTHEALREVGVRTARDRLGRNVLTSGRLGNRCVGQVWVDGVQLLQAAGPVDIDNYPVQTLAGVEYYSGPAQTPPEFNTVGATCGTLVLWTRER
ncbi:MAG: carboxypeptidase-like regulatory domain-containing protein [Gemmatimonadales bacterium]